MTLESLSRPPGSPSAASIARGLGWFSIGLGVAELLAPKALGRATGGEGHENLVRACGAREAATGLGILCSSNPAPWVWARVAGDALDLATLAAGARRGPKSGVTFALAAVAGVMVADLICARALSRNPNRTKQGPFYDYSDRSGFPAPVEQMRGIASGLEAPQDLRIPALMRPYATE